MRLYRFVLFLVRLIARSRLFILTAVGTVLLLVDTRLSMPLSILGFIIGGYSAAIASLALSFLINASGRFNSYCLARLGCYRFIAGIGLAAALGSILASMLSLTVAAIVVQAVSGRALNNFMNTFGIVLTSSALIAYGYAVVIQFARSSLPLIVLLAIISRLASISKCILYLLPVTVALIGMGFQAGVCLSVKFREKFIRRPRRSWRKALLRMSSASWQ